MRGLDVPRDMTVAGYGNFDLAALTVPLLTTIDVDAAAIGRLVGEALIAATRAAGRRARGAGF